ncbi:MAG: SDR family oxidoreductase [Chlorobi bacterium]|nr:SDR family oxidoreductase [Chlorobiota bacterium]
MKILITGSNGLLGQKLVHLFYQMVDINLLATSKSANKIASLRNIQFQKIDIENKNEVNNKINNYNPDVIINAAGITNVDECFRNKETCLRVNVEGTRNLVNAANSINAHYIHCSTDFVFSGLKGPYAENDLPNPVNYYGETKLDAEILVQEHCKNWAIVRTVLVYGVTENMNRSNIVLWVKKSLEKNIPIRVVNDQFRTPTLAEDLAYGCYLIAKKRERGIFHISGSEMFSIYEIAIKVAEFFNLPKELISPVNSKTLNELEKRPAKTGFIIEKAKNKLKYKPHSFIEGLEILQRQLI